MTGGNLISHGEEAIGKAQMGQRQKDMHVRVAVLLWALLGIGGALVFLNNATEINWPFFWAWQLIAFVIAVFAARLLAKHTRKKWAQSDAELRELRNEEKNRQLEEFMKAKNS